MKAVLKTAVIALALFMTIAPDSIGQQTTKKAPIQNYLSAPATITFDSQDYSLVWSSSPGNNYYKQEYLPKGQTVDKYTSMILLEALKGDITIQQAAGNQAQQIKQRKGSDPVANFNIIENEKTGEVILDFLLSEGNIVEWNAYRYKSIPGKGIELFGISKRTYGDETTFLKQVKENRSKWIEKLSSATMPVVKLP